MIHSFSRLIDSKSCVQIVRNTCCYVEVIVYRNVIIYILLYYHTSHTTHSI